MTGIKPAGASAACDRALAPAATAWMALAACSRADPALLLFITEDESWQDLALCSQADPEAFFPEKGGSTREAKAVCRRCEVQAECLAYALEHDERFGIWGGTSETERRALRRHRRERRSEAA
jgi:WhiB family transcriptional regulator, redox-sensing transcriptional regulator